MLLFCAPFLMCFQLLQNTAATAAAAVAAATAAVIEAANFIINSHAYIDKRCHRVCTQESPFRQFHSSLSLRTNLTMLHICGSSRCETRYYENKGEKGKTKNEHTCTYSIPFLLCPFQRLCTMGHYGYACYSMKPRISNQRGIWVVEYERTSLSIYVYRCTQRETAQIGIRRTKFVYYEKIATYDATTNILNSILYLYRLWASERCERTRALLFPQYSPSFVLLFVFSALLKREHAGCTQHGWTHSTHISHIPIL